MAVNLTTVLRRGNLLIVDVESTADGDTTATIPHGMGADLKKIIITPLQQATAALSLWAVTTPTHATNVVLTKATTAGSGGAGAQLRVFIEKIAG
jgi:hypothetical protein